MKTKLFFVFAFTIVSSTFIFSQNYFPLEAGNKWQFKVSDWDPSVPYYKTDTITVEVLSDTLMPDNNKYFKISGFLPFYDLFMSDSSGVYVYDGRDPASFLLFNYKAELDTPYNIGAQAGGESPSVVLNMADTSMYFSKDVKTLSFHFSFMLGYEIRLAKDIGPVYIHFFWDGTTETTEYNLIGYQIEGKSFGTLTGIKDKKIQPEGYKLAQNFPNPFNMGTIINYSVPKTSFVTLKVYDCLGREVMTLVNGEKPAGDYKARFDGSKLTSGIYFYRMHAGNFVQTSKMLFLK